MRSALVALVTILAGAGSASAETFCELYPSRCVPAEGRPAPEDDVGMYAGSDDTEDRLDDLERRQRQLEIETQFPYRRPGTRFD